MDYLTFQPGEPDPESDTIFVVLLRKKQATIRVKDFGDADYKFIQYESGTLAIGNENTVKVLKIPESTVDDKEEKDFEYSAEDVGVINCPMKIHGF